MNKKTQQTIEVLVIGGGASGMMASGRAAESGKKVVLLEKNKVLGAKLKITKHTTPSIFFILGSMQTLRRKPK